MPGCDAQGLSVVPGIIDLDEVRIERFPLRGAAAVFCNDSRDTAEHDVALPRLLVPLVEVIRTHHR